MSKDRLSKGSIIKISYLLLVIGSSFCLILSNGLIVYAAGIDLFGINDPPYRWDFISAGIASFFIGCLGLTSIFFFFRRNLILPIMSSIGMIFAGFFELLLVGDWHWFISPVILICGISLIICLWFLKSFFKNIAQYLRLKIPGS